MLTIQDPAGRFAWGTSHYSRFFSLTASLAAENMYSCREELASYVFKGPIKYLGYQHLGGAIDVEAVARFWKDVGDRIGTKDIIHETNFKNAIVVEIDPFWCNNGTRRSFFSLFLRSSVVYCVMGDTIEQSLDKYSLAQQIKPACLHFLSGHTTPTYDAIGTGVVSKFQYASQASLDQMLVQYFPVTK